ncbi:MAG: 50S ribosomal protein L11 methyltransferase [Gammaproteobacteria bacterium]|nr:50S ribosomal protein L11 methyltransferase [Gammaproteobacteria bacterium]MDP2142416.1 50S ribosomal protein L11 methyltransferase [Gammaproteobacteria bacterium]MDP2348657.1 50S ribosomal protein L11 methyltransferase [Gammaproteobacteria bacterium]
MPWQQLKIRVPEARAALVEDLLSELGAVSVTLQDGEDQPVFQIDPGTTPIWHNTEVVGLFEYDSPILAVVANLRARAHLDDTDEVVVEEVADTDWERVCMQDFKPMRFGERVWICPSWETPPEPNAVNIMLDPGLAFGTGTHPTTALCLEWLDQQDLQGKTVIDYGCGSGVLAIAAVLLGAGRVIAIDNDPQAIIATQSNRELNQIIPAHLSVHLPGVTDHPRADVLVANILSGPLEQLTPVIAALVKPGGKLILSGVLSQQTQSLMDSYQQFFTMLAPVTRDEWVRVEGVRR